MRLSRLRLPCYLHRDDFCPLHWAANLQGAANVDEVQRYAQSGNTILLSWTGCRCSCCGTYGPTMLSSCFSVKAIRVALVVALAVGLTVHMQLHPLEAVLSARPAGSTMYSNAAACGSVLLLLLSAAVAVCCLTWMKSSRGAVLLLSAHLL